MKDLRQIQHQVSLLYLGLFRTIYDPTLFGAAIPRYPPPFLVVDLHETPLVSTSPALHCPKVSARMSSGFTVKVHMA